MSSICPSRDRPAAGAAAWASITGTATAMPAGSPSRAAASGSSDPQRLPMGRMRRVIFPEKNEPFNRVLSLFHDGYVDCARYYYRKTKKTVSFVPLYQAPSLRRAVFGEPITFHPDVPIAQERERINAYLMHKITAMALTLPPHRVVPYHNIPKKDYPMNTED